MFKIICVKVPDYKQGILVIGKQYNADENINRFCWSVNIDGRYTTVSKVFFITLNEHRDKVINNIMDGD